MQATAVPIRMPVPSSSYFIGRSVCLSLYPAIADSRMNGMGEQCVRVHASPLSNIWCGHHRVPDLFSSLSQRTPAHCSPLQFFHKSKQGQTVCRNWKVVHGQGRRTGTAAACTLQKGGRERKVVRLGLNLRPPSRPPGSCTLNWIPLTYSGARTDPNLLLR